MTWRLWTWQSSERYIPRRVECRMERFSVPKLPMDPAPNQRSYNRAHYAPMPPKNSNLGEWHQISPIPPGFFTYLDFYDIASGCRLLLDSSFVGVSLHEITNFWTKILSRVDPRTKTPRVWPQRTTGPEEDHRTKGPQAWESKLWKPIFFYVGNVFLFQCHPFRIADLGRTLFSTKIQVPSRKGEGRFWVWLSKSCSFTPESRNC